MISTRVLRSRPLSARALIRAVVLGGGLVIATMATTAWATPANRAGLGQHYDRFLSRKLNQCTTCHLPGTREDPISLDEFPHNPFGDQLRRLGQGQNPGAPGTARDIETRLAAVADLDADADGVANEAEILLGHQPGNPNDVPTAAELETLADRQAEFARFTNSYRWRPFETVRPPPVPRTQNPRWARNPVDAFIAAAREDAGLAPRPEARREVLLRRVYLDLIGLSPTPAEQRAFLADTSPKAFETVVDRLLADPRHGERWGRHWMDVWRYSDWAGWADGNQIRDSQPHIWHWRDWIVESLNADKGYDRMLVEMLAADEVAPLDPDALRATGFLVRNYKMLSREQWMEDTIKHTSQAFLGVTVGCAKCHDHMTDPISQADYYRVRAIFEPHHVRIDRLPGELDTAKDGLARAFDTASNRVTHLLLRGDERHPDTNRAINAGVPLALCGSTALARTRGDFDSLPIVLPRAAAQPDRRDFVRQDLLAAGARAIEDATRALAREETNAVTAPSPDRGDRRRERQLALDVARARQASLEAVLQAEGLEDRGQQDSHAWTLAAMEATSLQRNAAVTEARYKLHQAATTLAAARQATEAIAHATKATNAAAVAASAPAAKDQAAADKAAREFEAARKQHDEATSALAAAGKAAAAAVTTAFQRRPTEGYPAESTGRRLAFARWLVDPNHPLTARVAMNHVWLRHFGRGLVPNPADFGRGARPPSHPALLDWLAAEFMARGWSMKAMHRLLVTSSTYRMASTPDEASARLDPDNGWLWRMSSRRLEAEAVRDNLLSVAGDLDSTMGGPDIDHQLGLTSKRRSLYLRLAAEKEVEFLRIFDGPTVTECYERRPSVVPQQALALGNSEMAFRQAASLAARLTASPPDQPRSSLPSADPRRAQAEDDAFIEQAYERVLARRVKPAELALCREFLRGTAALPDTTPADGEPRTTGSRSSAPGTTPTLAPDLRQRRRENLLLVLLNHNDFVTVR